MTNHDDDEPFAGGPAMTNDEVWDLLLAHRHPRMVAALAEEYGQGYADGYRDGYDPASRLKAEEIAHEHAVREGMIVGAAIIAWAEVIRLKQCKNCGHWFGKHWTLCVRGGY